MTDRAGRRRAGLLIPLFSCRTTASWGIGDIADLSAVTGWLAGAGQRVLQLLPINEMAPGQQSPYSAISAMAIDPIFIAVPAVPEFQALGGLDALDADDRRALDDVRRSPRVEYAPVRGVKHAALAAAFDRFVDREWRRDTPRARELREFLDAQAWWIDEYALFRAIHAREDERAWTEWPSALQQREPAALEAARRELWREVLFHQYLQWTADRQWRQARANTHGVRLFGDLPFMVDGDSADVWARQSDFRLDVSVGVPPDAFSATGQDWGMPAYDWDAIAAGGFQWLRDRARRSAAIYDGYRVDHLVGFYRTYGRPRDGGEPFFSPPEEDEQTELGERVLGILGDSGSEIIAEDLGIVPDFVRASLDRLGIPGYRVFRWEREWDTDGEPFRDPSTFPVISVATSGTHDTEPLVAWWDSAPTEERRAIAALPTVQRILGGGELPDAFQTRTRDVLLEALFAAASELALVPIQDAFGWSDRINEPATVTDANWTWAMPWPFDRLEENPEARERQARLREWSERYGRT